MEDEFEYTATPTSAKADRRSFLSAALATVTVAAVTGGAAALLLEDDAVPVTVATRAAPPSAVPGVLTPAPDASASTLRVQLRALEAENSTLKSSLTAAQQQLASYSNVKAEDSAAEEWRQRFEEANVQATDLAGQLAAVTGLLTLYEELEAVDLAAVASGGVAAVGGVLGGLIADVPVVTEGLQAGRKALDDFEEQLPQVEQGRYWLAGQIAIIQATLDAAEKTLSNAIKAGGTFLQLLDRWFEDILKWLPFGIGERAMGIMTAITELLAQVPETIDGLQANVAGPLDMWLERDGDENRLQRRLIKPVREEAFDRADSTVAQLSSVDDVFAAQLKKPIGALVERQQLIRDQIARYRQEHLV